jgi:hypothetical protein
MSLTQAFALYVTVGLAFLAYSLRKIDCNPFENLERDSGSRAMAVFVILVAILLYCIFWMPVVIVRWRKIRKTRKA